MSTRQSDHISGTESGKIQREPVVELYFSNDAAPLYLYASALDDYDLDDVGLGDADEVVLRDRGGVFSGSVDFASLARELEDEGYRIEEESDTTTRYSRD